MVLSDVEKAGRLAEQLASQIRNYGGNLSPVYYKLEEILIDYRKTGVDTDLVMPGIYEVDLEYNRTNPDGRSIWITYAEVLHDDLCSPNGSLHKKIEIDTSITGSSIITLIMSKLKLPTTSAMIIAPIAASIMGLGTKAFCRHSNECN